MSTRENKRSPGWKLIRVQTSSFHQPVITNPGVRLYQQILVDHHDDLGAPPQTGLKSLILVEPSLNLEPWMCVCGGCHPGMLMTMEPPHSPGVFLLSDLLMPAHQRRCSCRLADGGRAEAAFMFNDDEYFTSFCSDSAQNLSE